MWHFLSGLSNCRDLIFKVDETWSWIDKNLEGGHRSLSITYNIMAVLLSEYPRIPSVRIGSKRLMIHPGAQWQYKSLTGIRPHCKTVSSTLRAMYESWNGAASQWLPLSDLIAVCHRLYLNFPEKYCRATCFWHVPIYSEWLRIVLMQL